MQISAINHSQKSNSPQFKSAIPVYYMEKLGNGHFRPIAEMGVVKKLQKEMVTALNARGQHKQLKNPLFKSIIEKFQIDRYYKAMLNYVLKSQEKRTLTRSFYNTKGGWTYNNQFEPNCYLITGIHVDEFNERFGKVIGIIKTEEKKGKNYRPSADLKMAWHQYYTRGLEFVKNPEIALTNSTKEPLSLYAQCKVVRNNNGEIVDCQILDADFFAKDSINNPYKYLSNH